MLLSLSCSCNSHHPSSCLSPVWHSMAHPWQSSTWLDEGIKVGHCAGQFIWNIPGFRWYRKLCRLIKIYTRSSRTIPRSWNTYKVVNSPWLAWIIDTKSGLGSLFWVCCRSSSFIHPEKISPCYGSLYLEMFGWCVTLTDGIFIGLAP